MESERVEWAERVREFIRAANAEGVRMLMVGGGAVNWHGYKRHSADVDFWIERTPENIERVRRAVGLIGYDVEAFPESVHAGLQNVSIKFSPVDLDVELITRFSVEGGFEAAFARSVYVDGPGDGDQYWRVLSFEDLERSKLAAGRPKDLLDVQELRRIRGA